MADDLDRLTLLERAQLLHDATLRRHGEMLDRLDDATDRHESRLAALADLAERQQHLLDLLTGVQLGQADRLILLEQQAQDLRTLVQAIKDMLDRPNGH